jgi:hypothetical protein
VPTSEDDVLPLPVDKIQETLECSSFSFRESSLHTFQNRSSCLLAICFPGSSQHSWHGLALSALIAIQLLHRELQWTSNARFMQLSRGFPEDFVPLPRPLPRVLLDVTGSLTHVSVRSAPDLLLPPVFVAADIPHST